MIQITPEMRILVAIRCVCIVDVNGDGRRDILVGADAIEWWENRETKCGMNSEVNTQGVP